MKKIIEIESNIRNWGNSLGFIIPHNVASDLDLKPGEKVKILIYKKNKVLRNSFGALKTKKSTHRIMREIDRELYDD